MILFVLDASVALAWFIDRPIPPFAAQVAGVLEREEGRALVPALWRVEVSNGLVIAERRNVLTASDTADAIRRIEMLLVRSIESVDEPVQIRRALSAAQESGLTAYDAVYLDLARQQRLPLATLDRQLAAAAKKAGVTLLR